MSPALTIAVAMGMEMKRKRFDTFMGSSPCWVAGGSTGGCHWRAVDNLHTCTSRSFATCLALFVCFRIVT